MTFVSNGYGNRSFFACNANKSQYRMKTLTIGATRPISEQNTPLAPQIKAAAIRIARTVFNPWTISGIGVVTTASGILFWHETLYKVGAGVAVFGISIALMQEFIAELKGGKK